MWKRRRVGVLMFCSNNTLNPAESTCLHYTDVQAHEFGFTVNTKPDTITDMRWLRCSRSPCYGQPFLSKRSPHNERITNYPTCSLEHRIEHPSALFGPPRASKPRPLTPGVQHEAKICCILGTLSTEARSVIKYSTVSP